MARQIKRSDISEEDVFKSVRDSANETLKTIKNLNDTLNNTAKTLKSDIKDVKFGDASSIQKFTKAVQEANKAREQAIKLDKQKKQANDTLKTSEVQLEKIKQEKLKTEREEIRNAQLVAKEKERQAKAAQRVAKAAKDEKDAYKLLVKETRELKNQSKTLAVELLNLEKAGKKNTRAYRQLELQYNKVTKAAQTGDTQLKKIDKTVGDNFRNVGNYSGAIDTLKGSLMKLGAAFGVFQVVRGAGTAVVDFNQSVADLQAITGLGLGENAKETAKDLEFLKQQAIDTGTKIEGGATSVIEAYKLIASAKPELLENAKALDAVTQSAITLSQASGLDLPDAATRLTDAMNQFGAPAEEAGRFIDVLANGAKFGSAEIPQVTDALLKFGAVAKTSNVSIEESTALIEGLAEKGLKGAEAGTALRNVMLKLSAPDALPKKAVDALNRLGISFNEIQDTSKPFSERLEALKPLLKDNAALQQVFGKENAVAAINLIENTDRVEELTDKMGTLGTAQEQANTRTETLAGAFLELKNKFINWIISLNEGSGAGQRLINIVQLISQNLETIGRVIGILIKGFLAYKAIQIAVAARQKALNLQLALSQKGFKGLISSVGNAVKGMFKLKNGVKGAGTSVRGFGLALKSVPLVAAIGGVLELASSFWDVVSGADAAAIAMENAKKMQDQREAADQKTQDDAQNAREDRQKRMQEEFEKIERQRRKDIAETGMTQAEADAKAIKSKEDYLKLLKEEVKQSAKPLSKRFQAAKKVKEDVTFEGGLFRNPKARKNLINDQNTFLAGQNALGEAFRNSADAQTRAEKIMSDLLKVQDDMNEEIGEYNNMLEDVGLTQIEQDNQHKKTTSAKLREIRTEFSNQIDLLTKLNELYSENVDLQKELDDIGREQALKQVNEAIDEELKAIQEASKLGKDFSLKTYQELQNERLKISLEQIEADKKARIKAVEDQFNKNFAQQNKRLQDERKRLIENAKGNKTKIAEIEANYQKELENIDTLRIEAEKTKAKEIQNIELKANLDTANKRKEIETKTSEEIKKIRETQIEDVFERQLQAEELRLLKIGKKSEEIQSELDAKEIELLEKKIADKKALGIDALEDEIRLETLKRQKIADAEQAELDNQKKIAEQKKAIIQSLTDYAIKKSNERIAQIEDEIEAAEKESDRLRELANQGNIEAQESIAEQQRIIAEAERARQAELRRQERIKLASTVYTTYQGKVEAGSQQPLADTIRDVTLLQQFINTLPAFEEGTENTGKNGRGIDGKGGFQAILHPNERVMTSEQNDMVGDLSNNELAKIAQEYNAGKIIANSESAQQIGGAWASTAVIKKLNELQKTIESKPETNIELESIIDGAMQITRKTKEKNTTIYNRYRIK